ncbi:hypothetical protein LMG31506_04285 [Cupriavidus yeoncheonensis]|uniref:Uncharacterized protein n=1 Tax=Cupriavidus yeoncheonensis TaxID=1462994 RepID=A0A916IX64_9BURK|nr:hypothetical protein [Cupriavidus yeoncheonensis]CAG2150761.1 hypothetical protein LMG31506_04285 [Cupriavidus yeoncheonensis]
MTEASSGDSEPAKSWPETERDLCLRVGYYDFRAYTQLTSTGLSQGFVLVRHHTLCGIVQTTFRAGKAQAKCSVALEIALEKLGHLASIAREGQLPLGSDEHSI